MTSFGNALSQIRRAVPIFVLIVACAASAVGSQDINSRLSGAACFARTVGAGADRQSVSVIGTKLQSAALLKRGFVSVPCDAAFPSSQTLFAWRDKICALAANPNDKVQDQLEAHIGERPNVLCGMAEEVAGPWDERRAQVATPQKQGAPK